MKKFIYLVMIILGVVLIYPNISLTSTINVSASNIWTEYVSNPLFGGPTDGVNRGYYPCVIKVGSTYHIWYGDGTNTRHTTSTSPNFSSATFPAPAITGLAGNSYHPRVLYNASGWDIGGTHYADPFLMYNPTIDWGHIYVYHSANGDSWTQIGEVTGVINYGNNPTGAYLLDVLWEGGTTWKAYADNLGGYVQYYVSSDGLNWTGTAINILGTNLQPWETSSNFSGEHILKVGNYYILFYGSGNRGSQDNNGALGMAISTDGQNFIKSKGNPIFSVFNSPPSWRNDRSYTPYVLQDGSNWIMYFTGKSLSGGVYSIGYATNPGLLWLIQDAINAASNSDIINVGSGTYTEQLIINKELTIVGDVLNPDNVIIDGENKTTLPSDGQVRIYNPAGNVVFKGFKIINYGIYNDNIYLAFLTKGNNPVTVQNCKIIGHGSSLDVGWDYGFWSYNESGPLIIKDCYFSDMYHGILLEKQTGESTIENNTFNNLLTGLNTGSYYGGRAIEAITYGGTNVTSLQKVSGNTFTNFKSTGIIFSGGFSGSGVGKYTNVVIENNNFSFSTSNIVNNYGAINLRNVSSGNSDPNGGVTAEIHNNTINVPSGSGIQISGLNGNTGCHNNSIFGMPYNLKADAAFTTPIDATNNWWGTIIESEILAKLSGTITYDPWTGKTQPSPDNNIACAVGPAISLPNSGATIQFSHIGTNNLNPTITIQKIIGIPGTPASAGTPIPVYFHITASNLANYTFNATLIVDVSSIPGFNENTIVMFSSNGTTWLGANGTYNSVAHTYTLTTNHFSYIAFVNPLLSNEVNLYVSTSSTGYENTIYPNTSWNTPLTTSSDGFDWIPSAANHDWTYKHKTGTFYIVPVGSGTSPRSFSVATIKVAWNPNLVSAITVTEGNFFSDNGSNRIFTTNMGSNWVTLDASCLDSNQTPGVGKYIAKLDFTYDNDTSGYSPVTIQEVTIYYYDGLSGWQYATPVTQNMGGKLKCYLGDFASASSQDVGDGIINGTDLAGFSMAYWSSYTDPLLYKSKYDVGPTIPVRYYFGLPHPDGVINFEDLAVFSMGYSKTGSGTLPDNPKPIIFSLDKFGKDANGTLKLPVKISGGVNDVRAFSMKIKHGSDIEYKGVEMAGEMLNGTKFLFGKDESGKTFLDGASFDAFTTGLSNEGTIAYILFNEKTAGNHSASIESVIARNSGNLDLEVSFDGMNNEVGIPKTFNLSQNYPNPFNPVTKIEYALPKDIKVSIKIYDMLGREVSVLVNDMQKAGYYKLDWNGSSLASGVYFYQMVAGDFVAVKKMMMIK